MAFFATTKKKHIELGIGPTIYLIMSIQQISMPPISAQQREDRSLLVRVPLWSVPNFSNQMIEPRRIMLVGIDTDAKMTLTSLYRLFSRMPQKCFSVPEQFRKLSMILRGAAKQLQRVISNLFRIFCSIILNLEHHWQFNHLTLKATLNINEFGGIVCCKLNSCFQSPVFKSKSVFHRTERGGCRSNFQSSMMDAAEVKILRQKIPIWN